MFDSEELINEEIYISNNEYDEKLGKFYYDVEQAEEAAEEN